MQAVCLAPALRNTSPTTLCGLVPCPLSHLSPYLLLLPERKATLQGRLRGLGGNSKATAISPITPGMNTSRSHPPHSRMARSPFPPMLSIDNKEACARRKLFFTHNFFQPSFLRVFFFAKIKCYLNNCCIYIYIICGCVHTFIHLKTVLQTCATHSSPSCFIVEMTAPKKLQKSCPLQLEECTERHPPVAVLGIPSAPDGRL